MKSASLAAACAVSLLCGSMSAAIAADVMPFDGAPLRDARVAEECLLGSGNGEARFAAYQPFTREIAAAGIVSGSLAASTAAAAVPATVMLEAQRAFAATIDVERDSRDGDHFYMRYEQAFTAEGQPIGVGRLVWAELRSAAKGSIAIHRFRPSGEAERFWLASGEAVAPPSIRLPLDIVSVSSGFGWRLDPLDKPAAMPPATATAAAPKGSSVDPPAAPASGDGPAAPEQPVTALVEEQAKPARRAMRSSLGLGGLSGFAGPVDARAIADASRLDLERIVSERRAAARRAAAAPPVEPPPEPAEATEQASVAAPPAPRRLFMHDGVDLVAPVGTPIYAAADGIVTGAAPNGGYGNWIHIDHAAKLSTVYGHLSAMAPGIEAGVRVDKGELIGFVGNTGRSTGPHLHFELLSDGKAVDPLVHPATKRAQLRGADLERFRKQVKRALAERDRETALTVSLSGL
jgi:murein DD-endopeptidase MepM/ murein hydrolase activator NlpD